MAQFKLNKRASQYALSQRQNAYAQSSAGQSLIASRSVVNTDRAKSYSFTPKTSSGSNHRGSSTLRYGGSATTSPPMRSTPAPMSSLTNVTPSSSLNFTKKRVEYDPYDPGTDADWSQDDSERLNMQLQNALMMERLGYDAEFDDGQITYSRAEEDVSTQPSLTPYGAYGTQSNVGVWESDLTQQYQQRQQQFQPRRQEGWQNYTPYRQNYYQKPYYQRNNYYNGYRQYGNYGNQYYSQYYSQYGQRYNDGNSTKYKRKNYNRSRWYGYRGR